MSGSAEALRKKMSEALPDEERITEQAGKKLADIIEERLDDDDGLWRLSEEDVHAIIEIADSVEFDAPDGEGPLRDAVLIETTALVLQQRILYREKKGPGSPMTDDSIADRLYEAEDAFNGSLEEARKAGLRVDAKMAKYGHVLVGLQRLESRVFRPIKSKNEKKRADRG